MTRARLPIAFAFAVLLFAGSARAEWFDDYDAGLKAAKNGQWDTVVAKMSAAIAKKPKEGDKERTYGVSFIAYHPYYYRGIAYYELGQYQKAIDDLDKATGVGEVKLQSAESIQMKAQQKLAAATPAPTQTQPTATVAQQPVTPSQPAADPLLEQAKQRANALLAQADRSRSNAQQQKASSLAPGPFLQATEAFADARTRAATARSTADWQKVADAADNARGLFEASVAQAQVAIARQQGRPAQATEAVLGDTKSRVVRALDAYFKGDFSASSREFQKLASNELKNNAMIWAFLGAAQYSQYYLDGEASPAGRKTAEASFRTAKQLKRGLSDLPSDYFSPRIRKFYRAVR